ncbi:hypothetical protein DNK47_03265 [Mycoplasma wenyonii]|uniref:Uncharacterized protein n=1 Tax=Mycoplasma wenyonii TaxID=65123 RepID=A0A328PUJ0_9MOLU|nr:hypothetical protein [Mycoplasma wenyonii]RAO94769.1 hypothetical protein DNK47_03265 [Mycoplasma wenyonii]
MFLFTKLIGLGGTLLSSGIAISFLVPYFQNEDKDVLSNLIYKDNNSTNRFDLSALDGKVKSNIKRLEKQIQELSSAREITNNWKKEAHQNISTNLDKLTQKEEQLTDLYKELYSSLKQLIMKQTEIFQFSLKRLKADKENSQYTSLYDGYSQLSTALNDWENSIKEIKCEIDKNCDLSWASALSWIKSSLPFVSYLEELFYSKETESSEGAQRQLFEVSTELSKLLTKIKQKNVTYRYSKILSNIDKLLWRNKLSYLDALIAQLTQEKSNLDENIKSLIEKAKQLTNSINDLNNKLTEWLNKFTNWKNWETSLHFWNTKLKESLFRYRNILNKS